MASVAAGSDKLVPWFTGWACLEPTGARAASIEPRRPRTAESAVESADGHLPYALTVPGSHRAGPGDPGGALYGRTDYGRPRRSDGRFPRHGKGVKVAVCLLDDSGRSWEERVRVGNKGKSLIPSPKGGVLVG